MCLRVKYEKGEFPTVHVRSMYEKTKAVGKGPVGCVSFVSHGSKFSTYGEFDVKLNQYHLGASGKDGSDAVYWGGTVVHEMLHNLGHEYEDNDYTDSWQINIFEQCFMHIHLTDGSGCSFLKIMKTNTSS